MAEQTKTVDRKKPVEPPAEQPAEQPETPSADDLRAALRSEIEPELREALRKEIEPELREALRKEIEPELREALRKEIEAELRKTLREEVAKEYETQRRKEELQRVRQSLIEEYELNSEQIEVLNLLSIEDPKELTLRVDRLFGRHKAPTIKSPQLTTEPEVFTVSQIKDPAFWRQNKEKILRAAAEGRIVE